ncbi:alpha/beta hydrolase fold domain-containing protein [Streptomyces sp. NPDC087440]|uniref:alpha/beta hydrolase fold domain-containing protein n=1 Tax=Streptomyces sp. NPDC087440 TaxID=3365790 RepID=UPI0038039F6A
MASVRMRVLSLVLRRLRKPLLASAQAARKRIAAPKSDPAPPLPLLRRHRVSVREVEGFPVYSVIPRGGSAPSRAVVYWHGGAYTAQILRQHWGFVSALADAGCRVEVPLYGLTPDHAYREALPLGRAVHAELLKQFEPGAVTHAGDSSGGGLALAVTQTLAGAGLALPGRLVLLSPWLDLTMANPGIAAVEPHDPWLSSAGLIEAGLVWADGDDPLRPELSPLHGELAGLPELDIRIGTHDVFHPDCVALHERATAAGVRSELHEVEGGWHVYVLGPVPEGRRARAEIIRKVAFG